MALYITPEFYGNQFSALKIRKSFSSWTTGKGLKGYCCEFNMPPYKEGFEIKASEIKSFPAISFKGIALLCIGNATLKVQGIYYL